MSMDINGYQLDAMRTVRLDMDDASLTTHAVLGMVSEIGELCGLYQKVYQGHPFDEQHARKETGDILWFWAEYCTAMGWWAADVARENINKLLARYPEGFEAERSMNREEGDV